jgi:CheY-like chemotaxis protein
MKEKQKNKKHKILLVDDDMSFLESNKTLLEAEGYEVDVAYDGKSGFEKMQKQKPDLLIMDVMMNTDTEGFDISRKIASTPELAGLPIILVTGVRHILHIPLNIKPDKKWLPVETILEKPVVPDTLLAEIKKRLKD